MQTTVNREQTRPKTFDFSKANTPQAQPHTQQQPAPPETTQRQDSYAPQATMPIKSFRSGAICVSIWENETLGDDGLPRSYKTVSFDRRYKDKTGTWKSTNSLRANDLPRAVLILQKAYEYLVLTESESHDETY
jgi:hypothetical protein